MAAITVQDLRVRYGNFEAVKGVDFQLNTGEILGLLGPNGAGKTSIMNAIAGVIDYEGRIEILGIDAKSTAAKNLFGYVPEEPMLIDHLTPIEFFEFVVSVRKLDESVIRKIENFAEIFELDDNLHKPIASLSMGTKQKISVIAAIIHDPDVLILDEPLNGLDASSAKILKNMMRRQKERGSVLFSTHIMEIAEKICDRIVIVNEGRIVAEGELEDIKAGESLEDVFLKVTGQYGKIEEILDVL